MDRELRGRLQLALEALTAALESFVGDAYSLVADFDRLMVRNRAPYQKRPGQGFLNGLLGAPTG